MRSLFSLTVKNFLSLRSVKVDLQELSVLVGPNGAGKSNLLKVIQFLGDTARNDLGPAIQKFGGYERLVFRSGAEKQPRISLGITGKFTANSSDRAPDEYTLSFSQQRVHPLGNTNSPFSGHVVNQRKEEFIFKRTAGRGRRITVAGNRATIERVLTRAADTEKKQVALANTSTALSTLPRLGSDGGNDQINKLAELLTTFRVFEVDVSKARAPSSYDPSRAPYLDSDAANLASFLRWLHEKHSDTFNLLQEDLQTIAPSVQEIRFRRLGGTDENAVAVQLKERGLQGFTNLSEASFGTIRAMALLAMLHDPNPPKLTCVEEIDHGLHPHALDRIVERMRSAARKTQLLVVTHSPALANRLEPHELVVCERDFETGASLIPAVDPEDVAAMAKASALSVGELWFSGALGGGL